VKKNALNPPVSGNERDGEQKAFLRTYMLILILNNNSYKVAFLVFFLLFVTFLLLCVFLIFRCFFLLPRIRDSLNVFSILNATDNDSSLFIKGPTPKGRTNQQQRRQGPPEVGTTRSGGPPDGETTRSGDHQRWGPLEEGTTRYRDHQK
jgi:hypothetical protein